MPQNTPTPALSGPDALKWRCIGPPRGGRVVAVSGDPHDRMTFYFGACAGGIWKTVDGGVFWPMLGQPGAEWLGASDHRMVWLDLAGD